MSSAPLPLSRHVWLKVRSDGSAGNSTFKVSRDASLAEDLVPKLVVKLGLLRERVSLASMGVELDLLRSPAQLGLVDDQLLEANEKAARRMKLRLSRSNFAACTLQPLADAPLRDLVALYCETHAKDVQPSQVRLEFDGEVLELSKSPRLCT